jgi:hypothetical protein
MHRVRRLTGLWFRRLGVWLAVSALPAAVGCGSTADDATEPLPDARVSASPNAAGTLAPAPEEPVELAPASAAEASPASAAEGAPVSAAEAAPASAAEGAPANEPAPSNAVPKRPVYEVPVASDELKPFARFAIDEVNWRVTADGIELDYDFPAALSGKSGQRIALAGQLDASGHAQLIGKAGSADCTLSESVVRCDEKLTGLEIDAALARRMLSDRPELEQAMRGQVIESFSADPIGVLSFVPDSDSRGRGAE